MKGITVESNLSKGDEVYTIIKSKGKLTLDDIQQALAEHDLEGFAFLVLPVRKYQDSGWPDFDDIPGDAVDVIATAGWTDCPFCRRLLPPLLYCPNCSCKLKVHEDYKEGSE